MQIAGTETQQAAGRLAVRRVPETLKKSVAFLAQDTFLVLLLAATFFSGVLWAAVIPLWQIPDEPAHFGYIQDLGERASLFPEDDYYPAEVHTVFRRTGLAALPFHPETTQPFQPDSRDGPQEDEIKELPRSLRVERNTPEENAAKSYPSGYYLLASLVYRTLSSQDIFTIMFGLRIFSAFLTTITMLFTYLTLKRFFRDEDTARATVLIIALSPMYIYMGMAVNVDVLVWLLFSIYLYLLTRAFTDGLSLRLNLLLALTAALGLWVKQTFLLAVPFYLILVVFLNFRRTLTPSHSLVSLLVFFATIAALDGWLYLGGFIVTSPDVPEGTMNQDRTVSGFLRHFQDYWPLYRFYGFDSFWGNFGWLDTSLSQRMYDFLRWGCAAATGALIIHLVRSAISRKIDALTLFYLSISITFVFAFLVVSYLRLTSGEVWNLQGRYFFPMIGPIIGLLVLGVVSLSSARVYKSAVLLALVAGMAWFHADVLIRYVIPRFYA